MLYYISQIMHQPKAYRSFLIFLALLAGVQLIGQKSTAIHFDSELKDKFPSIIYPEFCSDSLDMERKIAVLEREFIARGHLDIGPILSELRDSSYHISIKPGTQFQWLKLQAGNVPIELLNQLSIDPQEFKARTIHYKTLANLMERIVDHFANNGFPFAKVKLKDILIAGNSISASINLEKNKAYTFGQFDLISEVEVSEDFFERHLGIVPGQVFDYSKVENISNKFGSLSFIRLKNEPILLFKGSKVNIQLEFQARKASRFDILIGLFPDPSNTPGIRITGDVYAALINKLGRGEQASFHYKNIRSGIQNLDLAISYPYLLNLPFGIAGNFNLYSNSELNRDIRFNLGIDYNYGNNAKLGLFWDNSSSRLISIDSTGILSQQKLPESLDFTINGLGFSYDYQNLDYLFNPRSGLHFHIGSSFGSRKIIPNLEISSLKNDEVDFADSYDSIRSGINYALESWIAYYIPIGKSFSIKTSAHSGFKYSKYNLLRNEAFRLGGSRFFRGFDEESIFASKYALLNLELRLLISRNSYLFTFGEYGFTFLDDSLSDNWDQPYGFGAGLSFDTGAGIILLSVANGSRQAQPINFNRSKIHIAYVSLF